MVFDAAFEHSGSSSTDTTRRMNQTLHGTICWRYFCDFFACDAGSSATKHYVTMYLEITSRPSTSWLPFLYAGWTSNREILALDF